MDALQLDLSDLLFAPEAERIVWRWRGKERHPGGARGSQGFNLGGGAVADSAGDLGGEIFLPNQDAHPRKQKMFASGRKKSRLSLGPGRERDSK